jgi:hypothetical protein
MQEEKLSTSQLTLGTHALSMIDDSYLNMIFRINGGSGFPQPGASLTYNATITFASLVPNPMIRVNNLDCECVRPLRLIHLLGAPL